MTSASTAPKHVVTLRLDGRSNDDMKHAAIAKCKTDGTITDVVVSSRTVISQEAGREELDQRVTFRCDQLPSARPACATRS
jgi:hypothetical protein